MMWTSHFEERHIVQSIVTCHHFALHGLYIVSPKVRLLTWSTHICHEMATGVWDPNLEFCHMLCLTTSTKWQTITNCKYSYSCVSECSNHVFGHFRKQRGKGRCAIYWGKTRVACFGYLMIPDKWNISAVRYAR